MGPMTMPVAPRKVGYHHGDLRNALVAAALKLVAKHGVEGFSLREAARAVGVSPAAAYRHFEDRSALLKALAHEGLARLALKMEEAVATAPGVPGSPARAAAELAAIGAAYVEFAVAHASHFRVMFGPWCDLERRAGAGAPAARSGSVAAARGHARRHGSRRRDHRRRRGRAPRCSVWSAVHGFASLLVEGGLPLGAAERARAYVVVQRMLLLGLGVSPELAGPPLGATLPDLRPERARRRSRDSEGAAGRGDDDG